MGALAVLAGCGPQTPPCEITLGWDPWEPYQYQDVDGTVVGLDIELVKVMADRAECTLSYEENDWAALLGRVRDGVVDIVLGATLTENRQAYAHFSEPYRAESFGLFTRSGEASNYNQDSLQALLESTFKIGITDQYLYGDEVTALQDDPRFADQFEPVRVGEANFAKLMNFEIDGFLEDPFVAAAVIRRKGLQDDVEPHPIVIETGNVRLMFSKASVSEDVVRRFNEALAAMTQDGSYEKIVKKYEN